MIENPPVLTIRRGWKRPAAALLEGFREADLAQIVDAMDGRGALAWTIRPLDAACARFVAPALTAAAYPADIVAVLGALHEAQAGDAIVVACEGFAGAALCGDIVAGMMHNKGVAAFVTDGMVRDRAGVVATGMPVFCHGVTPNSAATNGPGEVGVPVVLGGVRVAPGDILVGDADGVVVVPQARAAWVLERLARVRAAEAVAIARVQGGATSNESVEALAAGARILEA